MSRQRVYRCSPSIVWVKDRDQTLLVHRGTQRSWALQGVEAVIWDLVSIDYPYQNLVSTLALLLSLPEQEAEHRLGRVLEAWHHAGVIYPSSEDDSG